MLREIVKNELIENVLRPQNYDQKLGTRKLSVLIVDKVAMQIVDSCLGLNEVFEEGVTLIEDLTRKREPLPTVDAIYLIFPSEDSIQSIIDDCARQAYKSANIYLLATCPDEIFRKLAKSGAARHVQTLKELNLAFRPLEKQIFTVNGPDFDQIVSGIVGVCDSLRIAPVVTSPHPNCSELVRRIELKLCEMRKNANFPHQEPAQLVILDRNFDLVTPFLHETTLQAMAADVLDFQSGFYTFSDGNGQKKVCLFDENDPIWLELRHQHVAKVLEMVAKMTREQKIAQNSKTGSLGDQIRRHSAQQKVFDKLSNYINLADECKSVFFEKLEQIIQLEQDMATGFTQDGEKMTDSLTMRRLSSLILPAIPVETRLRLILIFMMTVGREKDEKFFARLLEHTDIPKEKWTIILDFWKIRENSGFSYQPKNGPENAEFVSHRWEPRIAEIFRRKSQIPAGKSARIGGKLAGKTEKLVFFVLGGITYSEMRAAYLTKNSTIFLGSDRILTPNQFLCQ